MRALTKGWHCGRCCCRCFAGTSVQLLFAAAVVAAAVAVNNNTDHELSYRYNRNHWFQTQLVIATSSVSFLGIVFVYSFIYLYAYIYIIKYDCQVAY